MSTKTVRSNRRRRQRHRAFASLVFVVALGLVGFFFAVNNNVPLLLFSSPSKEESRNNNRAAASPTTVLKKKKKKKKKKKELITKPSSSANTSSSSSSAAESAVNEEEERRRTRNSPLPLQKILERKQAYEATYGDSDRWKLRGLGYLYEVKGLVLEAFLVQQQQQQPSGDSSASSNNTVLQRGGRNVVRVVQQQQQQQQQQNDAPETAAATTTTLLKGDECSLLTMWIRVNGPEIFAGRPRAITTNAAIGGGATGDDVPPCYWDFDFNLQVPGEYEIETKLLVWNGNATITAAAYDDDNKQQQQTNKQKRSPCRFFEGGPSAVVNKTDFPYQAGFQGFKLYKPVEACCEICSRLAPHCKQWATPPDFFEAATRTKNGCELYYSDAKQVIALSHLLPKRNDTTRQQISRRRMAEVPKFHGFPHNNPTAYFLGCGWSMWSLDYPCLDGGEDDRVYVAIPKFTFSGDDSKVPEPRKDSDQPLPLCTLNDESLDGTKEASGRWVRQPFPNETICPYPMERDEIYKKKFDIMKFDGEYPHCWHRDDFRNIGNRCIEMNCRFIKPHTKWFSPLHNESEWFGMWRPYRCDYLEYTNEELQKCITDLKVTKISTEGASIAEFANQYLSLRLENMTMYDGPDGRTVWLSTLGMLHKAALPNGDVPRFMESVRKPKNLEDIYFMSSFFLSSERDTYSHNVRMDYMNRAAYDVLPSLGYKMINAFDLSAAFTYDTATQMDGMHLIGPPMKMTVTKLFHYMCKDVVTGGRRVGSTQS